MSELPSLVCPSCGQELARAAQEWKCNACALAWRSEHGVVDLRAKGSALVQDPWPWTQPIAEDSLARLRAGEPWKQVFERALLALDDERADHLMLLTREARGAWLVFLSGEPGTALCIGNASSGAAVALARAGHRVVLIDRSRARLELGLAQLRAMAGVEAFAVCVGENARAPFQGGTFDLVLQERGLPQARADWEFSLTELARIGRGELVFSANNRLGYKRSAGRRADFRVPSPFAYLYGALFPAPGVKSLRGHRAELSSASWSQVRAFALYPHQSDFTHLVALDPGGPGLTIGPKERRNRAKLLASKLGLFPWLTPSFALLARASNQRLLQRTRASIACSTNCRCSSASRGLRRNPWMPREATRRW